MPGLPDVRVDAREDARVDARATVRGGPAPARQPAVPKRDAPAAVGSGYVAVPRS